MKTTRRIAGLAILGALHLTACLDESGEESAPPPLNLDSTTETCVDEDQDGYVVECNGRRDCDDSNPDVTNECYASTCAEELPGCECDPEREGERIECELAHTVLINGVVCGAGEMVCDNGEWGECILNNSVYKLPEDHSNHQTGGTPTPQDG